MKRVVILLSFLLAFQISTHAQLVDIPDSNLRAAVRDALNGAPITQATMRRLTKLDAVDQGIVDLTGLEHATNLTELHIFGNPLAELTPIAKLKRLTYLDIAACSISDISPLSKLARLTHLNARYNQIIDITPLAHLKHLKRLWLSENRITDVAPLAGLNSLEFLEIQNNQITDHSPLDTLSLSHFVYDQSCEMPPFPLYPRLENRQYPSIMSRWGEAPILNRPDLSGMENLAYHDLRWNTRPFGLQFFETPHGFTMTGDLNKAIQERDTLQALNPNMIHLVDVGMRGAPLDWFPEDWPYWIRDEQGDIFHGLMDFTHPHIQDRIVQQAIAVSKCGLYDGIFFDFWSEAWPVLGGWYGGTPIYFRTLEDELRARLNIVERIRANTRPNFLIMGNTNDSIIPDTGPYMNGGFMETGMPGSRETAVELEEQLSRVENALLWLEYNLKEPRINGLEGEALPDEPLDSPANLRWMRAITALSLTHSDGYVLFTDSSTFDHYWYDFWDADLGRPVDEKGQLHQETEGLYIREYTNGWAVYNHSGEAQVITLPEEAQGVASGRVGAEHTLPNLDGEMYLRMKPENPADVNGDGAVNILDLVAVAQAFGRDGLEADVNGDGVVNVFDLVQVAGAIGGGGAAPSASSLDLSIISAADVEKWLALARGLGIGDANFQRGIRFLEGLLAALTPKETMLLPNYPNPFNPETWIPYRLAREAEVAITIYDTKGTPVRRLALGNQATGYYAERGKAAYWDGRNENGEAVASGIYIYQFRAGDYVAARRMVIVK